MSANMEEGNMLLQPGTAKKSTRPYKIAAAVLSVACVALLASVIGLSAQISASKSEIRTTRAAMHPMDSTDPPESIAAPSPPESIAAEAAEEDKDDVVPQEESETEYEVKGEEETGSPPGDVAEQPQTPPATATTPAPPGDVAEEPGTPPVDEPEVKGEETGSPPGDVAEQPQTPPATATAPTPPGDVAEEPGTPPVDVSADLLPPEVTRWLRSTGVNERGEKIPEGEVDHHWSNLQTCDAIFRSWGAPIGNVQWMCSPDSTAQETTEFAQKFNVEDPWIHYQISYLVSGGAVTMMLNNEPLEGCASGDAGAHAVCDINNQHSLVQGENTLKAVVHNNKQQVAFALFANVQKPGDTVVASDRITNTGTNEDGTIVGSGHLDTHWYDMTDGKPFRVATTQDKFGAAPFDKSMWVRPDGTWDSDPALSGLGSTYVVATPFEIAPEDLDKKIFMSMQGGSDVLSAYCDRNLIKACSIGGYPSRDCEFDIANVCTDNSVNEGHHELMVVFHNNAAERLPSAVNIKVEYKNM